MKDTAAANANDERPERKKASSAGNALSTVGSWPQRTKAFLGDVRAELRRVTWPTRKQIQATTVVVIVTVFFFGAYFGILDWLFTRAVGWLLQAGQ